MKPLGRMSGFLSSSALDKFQLGCVSDSLVMTDLGSGISRGCMDLGRLYQGKYVPPERSDGLGTEYEHIKEREDVISELVAENDMISKITTEKNFLDSDPTYIDLD